MNEKENEDTEKHGLADKISGLGQKIIGEIETIGGVLTGDPITQAEGEYNVEVGDVREDLEDDIAESARHDAAVARDDEE
ncbi:MAG: hypothetical protein ABI646_08750 [Acidobacteriota bacterium]